MRLARIGPPGREVPVAAGDDGRWRDLRDLTADVDGDLLAGGLDRVAEALRADTLPAVGAEPDRFGPPLAGIGKIVCIGLNYRDHAARDRRRAAGRAGRVHEGAGHRRRPGRRRCSCPRGSTKTDWEVELAVVIGRDGPLPRLDRGGRRGVHRRVRGRARRLRAGVPARARRAVGQGQELRDVQPARPVAGDRGRGARPAGARPAAVGQRRAAAGRHDRRHDLRRRRTSCGTSASSWCCTPATSSTPGRRPASRSAARTAAVPARRATWWSWRSTGSAGSARSFGARRERASWTASGRWSPAARPGSGWRSRGRCASGARPWPCSTAT